MFNSIENIFVAVFLGICSPMILVLVACACALVVTNPFFLAGHLNSKQRQPPSGDIADVSGLYGPGTYWAWVLCTISAIVSSSIKGHSSSIISPDQIVSFVYSTFSTYGYYIRVVWYGLEGHTLLQDHSAQAAAFVLHMSTLFHALGAIFSTEDKEGPWLALVVWDYWLLWISPMMTIDLHSRLITSIATPIVFLCFFLVAGAYRSSPWRVAPSSLLLFIFLEAVRTQYFVTHSFCVSPKTTYSLTDLDQLVSLASAIAVMIHQWELWNPPKVLQRLKRNFSLKLHIE
ncbi:hypothetical protein CPB86DRAFT_592710 [Serendipita vermifera]|nr:hypothetical protein CPB86DRAFT_592710 [Serendipita vermifera]